MKSSAKQSTARPLDLYSVESRSSLAKMVTKLMGLWELTPAQQADALGLSAAGRGTLSRYRKGSPLAANRDLVERAGHLLGIHKSLRIIFPHDRDLAYRWMKTRNAKLGATPIEIVEQRGFEGLLAIRRYLDFERGR